MPYALLVPHPERGLAVVHELAAERFGHDSLAWVDVSAIPGVAVGWVQKPDGSLGPYVPDLETIRAERVRALRFECFHAIIGGFTSSALAAPHRYDSDDTDQKNIDRAAIAAFVGGDAYAAQIPCADADGLKAVRAHNGKQAVALASDLHAHVEAARVRFSECKAAVSAATTAQAVAAIQW